MADPISMQAAEMLASFPLAKAAFGSDIMHRHPIIASAKPASSFFEGSTPWKHRMNTMKSPWILLKTYA